MKKIAIILGTRPEIIKCAPIVRELDRRNTPFFILHTNQHYSASMDEIFLSELNLPKAKYNLGITANKHGRMVGKMLVKIEEILLKERPDWILVQGDTNTVLAGALAASKIGGIKIGHVEAGLRSYDRTMPEELNRVAADHFADALFCPTVRQAMIASDREGIPKDIVFVTGNTVVDAVKHHVKLAVKDKRFVHFANEAYLLLTMHRPSNVDEEHVLRKQLANLERLSDAVGFPIYYPIHPRALKQIERFGILVNRDKIKIQEPTGYLEMLAMIRHAKLVLTDSGGLQEEACILRVPCVTLRENTERPETIEVGANVLVGSDLKKLLRAAKRMLRTKPAWYNPYGDGTAAKKIVQIIHRFS